MIYFSIPWDTKKNLGRYYNQFLSIIPNDNDFACFIDGDASFTTTFFGKQLEDIIAKYPECGIFTAYASRIGCSWQQRGPWDSDDMLLHREIGKLLAETQYDEIEDHSHVGNANQMGGVLMLIRKSSWEHCGKFNEQGILGIDNDFHRKAEAWNEKVYLMKGVYLYHYYRMGKKNDKTHLQ